MFFPENFQPLKSNSRDQSLREYNRWGILAASHYASFNRKLETCPRSLDATRRDSTANVLIRKAVFHSEEFSIDKKKEKILGARVCIYRCSFYSKDTFHCMQESFFMLSLSRSFSLNPQLFRYFIIRGCIDEPGHRIKDLGYSCFIPQDNDDPCTEFSATVKPGRAVQNF